MRKNRKINSVDLYERIKKVMNNTKVAIKVDNPKDDPNSPLFKTKTNFMGSPLTSKST